MAGLVCPGANVEMSKGTTLCPHCNTRFKITEAQIDTLNGMVRCGLCQRVFDARPNFVPDMADRQLKLPILDEPDGIDPSQIAVLQPMTLAEQVAIVKDEEPGSLPKKHTWLWAFSILLLFIALLAQYAYFFRVDIAAKRPALKPALMRYCKLLKCSVPLPQKADYLSIESSGLEANPEHKDQIILHALLRNRAAYTQEHPSLELTLNDLEDQPIARRIFLPSEYLPSSDSETSGLLPNHEVNVKLHLNTGTLKPVGYRLKLVYPGS